MWDVIQHLERVLPADAIITNGAGNYTTWVHRFHRYRGFRTQLAPDLRRDGLWRARGHRRESAVSASARSSRSPATVAS